MNWNRKTTTRNVSLLHIDPQLSSIEYKRMKTEREKRLQGILRTLLDERLEYSHIEMPAGLKEQQHLMRALLNIRPPHPVSQEFMQAQDKELQEQLAEKGVVELEGIPSCHRHPCMRLWQGDITRLHVDAITNAANNRMLGCFVPLHGCIDNAIHSAAGVQLRLECQRIMETQGYPEPTGCAKLTGGYNLPARYVIHTVGPIVPDGVPSPEQEKQLASCYRSCLELADRHALDSIAFCCISTGEFRFPNRLAAQIAIATVTDYLEIHKATSIKNVIFNVFKDEDYLIYRQLLG